MKRKIFAGPAIFSAILFLSACSKGTSSGGTGGGGTTGGRVFDCTGITPKFSTDIQPILTSVCSINSNCHAGGSTNSGGPFTNFTEVNAKKSNIRAAILGGTMPQTGSISQAQVNAFICWIDSGAPNN
jgi:hypothetical protein